VKQIPSSLPPGGVVVANGVAILEPATPRRAEIGVNRAITLAHRIVKPDLFPPRTLFASLAKSNSRPTRVWLLTFTSAKPENLVRGCPPGHTCPPYLVRHVTVALDASTGRMVSGFYTQ
jgi:hypothetical protein